MAGPRIVVAKTIVHALCALPLAWLAWDFWQQSLGADPVAQLTHRSGIWAIRLLLVTLAMTPLRRVTGWPGWIRFRRLLGLWTFAYASVHFSIWLLDMRGYPAQMLADIAKRPFVTVGFLAWLLLVPLAVTSTRGMIRRLGRNWQRLHRLVYAIGVLAVLHFWWLVKTGETIARVEPVLYAATLAVLLLARVRWRRAGNVAAASAAKQSPLGSPELRG